MAFDLDPGPGTGLAECCEVALLLRDALGQLGLECFAKTSGSKGIQVYVPLNVDDVDYDHGTKRLSNALARHLESQHPKLIVSSQRKELRKDKVLIDWSQNDEHKTTVSASTRCGRASARRSPRRSPGTRSRRAIRTRSSSRRATCSARVEEHGDLFAPVAELEQRVAGPLTQATTVRGRMVDWGLARQIAALAAGRGTEEPPPFDAVALSVEMEPAVAGYTRPGARRRPRRRRRW